jgi:hypothetical protein
LALVDAAIDVLTAGRSLRNGGELFSFSLFQNALTN